jgi:hypothetical protein
MDERARQRIQEIHAETEALTRELSALVDETRDALMSADAAGAAVRMRQVTGLSRRVSALMSEWAALARDSGSPPPA